MPAARTRAAASAYAVAMADDIVPMLNSMPCFADSFRESVFSLIVQAPLAAVIHFDEVRQGALGAKKLAFGVVALNFGGQLLGHRQHSAAKT